jgi:hypothetical protein
MNDRAMGPTTLEGSAAYLLHRSVRTVPGNRQLALKFTSDPHRTREPIA